MTMRQVHRLLGALAVLALVLFPLLYGGANYSYVMHLWVTALFYAILASSWALLAGYAGQFSFGHMAFMAIGAYTAGLFDNYIYITSLPTGLCTEVPLGTHWLVVLDPIGLARGTASCLETARAGWPADALVARPPLWLGILLGILAGGLFGVLIGALVLRLRAAYLALFTVGFSEIVRAVISAEIPVTRGQAGLELRPLFPGGVTLFGTDFDPTDKLPPYYVMLLLFLGCLAIMGWLVRSRFGLFIRALREDEEAAQALAVHTVRYKILVFVVTSMMAAAAGAVQAHYIGIITPNILIILQMSLVIAMAVIGGMESIVSAAIGAIVIQFALELLRSDFSVAGVRIDMSTWRLVFFGLLLMLTLRFWRNGLIHTFVLRFERAAITRETLARRAVAADRPAEGEPESAP
jgi:branched-chain amino acid transport system permease protein